MVNRVWHYHFGRGIVATPSDFGFNGDRPSHPELLDWLAAEYLANGGRLKPIHRLIVLSAAYRQSSRLDDRGRGRRRATTACSGGSPRGGSRPRRSATRSSPSPARSTAGWAGRATTSGSRTRTTSSSSTPRPTSAPTPSGGWSTSSSPRSQPDPTFGAFDCPDGGLVAPRRNVSTTALQALNLLNSRFVLDQSGRFADRLAREAGPDPAAQADRAFRLAFGRDADRRRARRPPRP